MFSLLEEMHLALLCFALEIHNPGFEGIVWSITNFPVPHLLQGSFGAFALIDLAKKIPQTCRVVPERSIRWKKLADSEKKAGGRSKDSESIICLRYNSILHMDFISNNEMIVVEQPWLNVIAKFPAPLERKIYGT